MDSTAYALQVLNDTDYGNESGLTNGEIVSEWGYKQEKEFCLDYLEFITCINGVSELYQWEKDMQEYFENGDTAVSVKHVEVPESMVYGGKASVELELEKYI